MKTIMSLRDIVICTSVDVKMSKSYQNENGVVNERCRVQMSHIDVAD